MGTVWHGLPFNASRGCIIWTSEPMLFGWSGRSESWSTEKLESKAQKQRSLEAGVSYQHSIFCLLKRLPLPVNAGDTKVVDSHP